MNMGDLWRNYCIADSDGEVQDEQGIYPFYCVNSSNIRTVAYLQGSECLFVTFHGTSAGYKYKPVSMELFKAFAMSDSLGRFLNEHIKGHINHERIFA